MRITASCHVVTPLSASGDTYACTLRNAALSAPGAHVDRADVTSPFSVTKLPSRRRACAMEEDDDLSDIKAFLSQNTSAAPATKCVA